MFQFEISKRIVYNVYNQIEMEHPLLHNIVCIIKLLFLKVSALLRLGLETSVNVNRSYLGDIHFHQILKIITKLHVCQTFVQNHDVKKHFKNVQKNLYYFVILRS